MVRAAAPLGGIVAAPGLLLLAVDHDHGGVYIEHEAAPPVGREHPATEPIVQPAQLGQGLPAQPEEKPAQRRGIRIGGQPRELLEDAIAGQQVCAFQPLEPEEHRIEQRQQHLSDAVARIALWEAHTGRQGFPQAETGEEPVQKIHATEVRKAARTEAETHVAGSFGHDAQPYLLVSYHSNLAQNGHDFGLTPGREH